jgi:arylsulfatase A-like enzyme
VIAVAMLTSPGCAPERNAPARVVVVTIDTLRADHVGTYGSERARTPILDGLAREGVRFDAAFSPVPLTLPAHATLLTGLDPDRHGVRHNAVFTLAPEIPSLPERLRAAGFGTAAFVGAFVLDRRFGLARGFDVYDAAMDGRRSGRAVVGFAERRADAVVDAFLGWLESAPERFFAWVHVYDPHADYDPPAGFSLGFAGRPYDGEIAFVDSQLGRLFEALDARFDPADTLVVVTSDHGEALGEHGEPTHSYSLYEATQRIPMIWRGPGFRGGRTVDDVVRLADVAPTILAALGQEPFPESSGRDLAPLLRGDAPPARAYAETLATHLDYAWSALFSVRDTRWRYIRAPEPELYDLDADPRERRNVAAAQPEVVRELDAWLAERLANARPLGTAAALSSEERARLQALGYVAGAGEAADADFGGPDPKQRTGVLVALERAEALGGAGRWADAFAQLQPLEERGDQFLLTRASFAVRAGLFDAAEGDLEAAMAQAPNRPDVLRLRALVEELRRNGPAARALYESVLVLDASDAQATTGLGRLAEIEGDAERAEAHYREALVQQPGQAEATWRLAALRAEHDGLDEAQALLVGAGDAPEPFVVWRVASAEAKAGRLESAAARLDAALRGPVPTPLVIAAAPLLEAGGRGGASLRIQEEALRADPDTWQIQNGVAWNLAKAGRDLDRALDLARTAVRASGEDPAVLDTLAAVQLRRGEAAPALASADRALRRTTESALRSHLYWVRAQAAAALGRRGEARRDVARALAGSPGVGASWRADAERFAREIESDTSASASPP